MSPKCMMDWVGHSPLSEPCEWHWTVQRSRSHCPSNVWPGWTRPNFYTTWHSDDRGMNTLEFQALFGTEELRRDALVHARWLEGFPSTSCDHHGNSVLSSRDALYQSKRCRKQNSPMAGTILRATNQPLTTWFYAMLLIGIAENGSSAGSFDVASA